MDAALIENKVLHSSLRKGKKGIFCKLDLQVYDHVSWCFFFYMLKRLGLVLSGGHG